MKYDMELLRLHTNDPPMTDEEIEWVHKQATLQKVVSVIYIDHVNKVEARFAKAEGRQPMELVDFHVSLGDGAQESSIFELVQSLLNIDYSKAERKFPD